MRSILRRREFVQRSSLGLSSLGLSSLGLSSLGLSSLGLSSLGLAGALRAAEAPKRVAAVVTIYRENSHADVLVGKILQGWKQDGGPGPALKLSALYVDQFPKDDLSVGLSKKFGFPIVKTIAEALTLGGDGISVDGVLSIGEHGDYPTNEKGQHLYPRRRFFEEITDTMHKHGKVVPLFNDKHPGPQLQDMLWMAERARSINLPWMAGSSLTVGNRDPEVTLDMRDEVEACLAVGYSGLDVYGFHTLDVMQSILERRRTGDQGVRAVQCLSLDELPRLISERIVREDLLDAALESSQTNRQSISREKSNAALFLIEYRDGLKAPVLMLTGVARAISVAVKPQAKPLFATRVEERPDPKYPHFAHLLRAIELMIHSGKPSYPVERTLLASGMLDRLLTSRHSGGNRLDTPELAINYQPVDYPFARN